MQMVKKNWGYFVGVLSLAFLVCTFAEILQNYVDLKNNSSAEAKQRLDASLEILKLIVSGIGTVATAAGGFILYLNFKVAERNVKLTQAKLRQESRKAIKDSALAQSRLITDRFSKAVEQLGDTKLAIQLGGIYSLERIAKDSPQDYWTVMQVLTAFVRQNSKLEDSNENSTMAKSKSAPKAEIQAVIAVIVKRKDPEGYSGSIDLRRTNLRKSDFTKASFVNASLGGSDFSSADLSGAFLDGADLSYCDLTGTKLNQSKMYQSSLSVTKLSSTTLNGADLSKVESSKAEFYGARGNNVIFDDAKLCDAKFGGTQLFASFRKAVLTKAYFGFARLAFSRFEGADLSEVDFSKAILTNTHFEGANLNKAILNGAFVTEADFRGAKNLDIEQIKLAKDFKSAHYDPDLKTQIESLPDE
jgi:uncharacterized protein YjbI with pentapeptide repeats